MTDHEEMFVTSVESAFAFLCRDLDFELDGTTADTNALGFSSYSAKYLRTRANGQWQSVTIQTTPDRGELCIDLASRLPASDSPEFTLTLCELHEIESSKPNPSYSVSDAFGDIDMMTRQYKDLASLLRDYGSRFFGSDGTLAADIDALRKMPRKERERRQKDRAIEAAITAGEWGRVVVYLEGLGSTKTPEQRESLKLARAKIRLTG